ncbi:glycogen synthase [Candidatus Margulisiibacteriota bacterium]
MALKKIQAGYRPRIESSEKPILIMPVTEFGELMMSGGYGIMVYGLARQLQKMGNYDLYMYMPLYKKFQQMHKDGKLALHPLETAGRDIHLHFDYKDYQAKYYIAEFPGTKIKTIFVDLPGQFDQFENNPYFDVNGNCVFGSEVRYSLFGRAFWELMISLDKSRLPKIIHAHEWHTGPLTALHDLYSQGNQQLKDIKKVFTVHNEEIQGDFPLDVISQLGFNSEYMDWRLFGHNDRANFLKMALVTADMVTTVSKAHAGRICRDDYPFAKGLNPLFQELARIKKLIGITNGTDFKRRQKPITPDERARYTKYIVEKAGLKFNPEFPVVGSLGRIDGWQKGIDLLQGAIKELIPNNNFQFLLFGDGDHGIINDFRNIGNENIGIHGWADRTTVEAFMKGIHFFMLPSRFDPFGLTVIEALSSGAIPIVSPYAGSADVIINAAKCLKTGTGCLLGDLTPEDIKHGISYLIKLWYEDKDHSRIYEISRRAQKRDYSWRIPAKQHLEVYNSLLG